MPPVPPTLEARERRCRRCRRGRRGPRSAELVVVGLLDRDDVVDRRPSSASSSGRDVDHRARGDVVEDDRGLGGGRDRLEVGADAGLVRLVVVRRDDQDGVGAGRGGPLGQLDRVAGVVGAGPADHGGVGRRSRRGPPRAAASFSSSSSVGDSPVVPGDDEAVRSRARADGGRAARAASTSTRAVVGERRHHRRDHSGDRRAC